jgi:hypothetical protein
LARGRATRLCPKDFDLSNAAKWVLGGLSAGAALLVAGTLVIHSFSPGGKKPGYVQGRPLLESDGPVFSDAELGLRFTYPPGWALQARAAQNHGAHSAERLLVKYKRVVPPDQLAWLSVNVADANDGDSPDQFLRGQRAPESNWKVTKPIEMGLTVGGQPAARVVFGGPFNSGQKASRDFTCELVAVKNGQRIFLLAGMFAAADKVSQQQVRAAIESAVFER